jgi:uncharacterized protein (DUF2267 family)
MSMTDVPTFDKTIVKTNRWLTDLQQAIGADDRNQAYLTLRAVLHALRDRIPPDEVAQLSAQLPTLIRGFFSRAGILRTSHSSIDIGRSFWIRSNARHHRSGRGLSSWS